MSSQRTGDQAHPDARPADASLPDREPFAGLCERARMRRGSPEDEQWAARATIALIIHRHASTTAAAGALEEALDTAAEADGAGLEELYGTPDRWAEEQSREWARAGADAFDTEPTFSLRRAAVTVPATAAVFSLLLGLSQLLQGRLQLAWTPMLALMPLILAALVTLANSVHERVKRRLSFAGTAVITALSVAALSFAAAGLFVEAPGPRQMGSLAWILVLAAGYAALAWLLHRTLRRHPVDPTPSGQRTAAPASMADDQWEHLYLRAARTRDDLPTARIEDGLLEARAHAADAGQSIVAQFGDSAAFARSLPGDARVLVSRRAWLYGAQSAAVILLIVLGVLTSRTWGLNVTTAMLVSWAVLIVWSFISSLRDLRATRADGSRRS